MTSYCGLVYEELVRRGYAVADVVLKRLYAYIGFDFRKPISNREPFAEWHTNRYLKQCYYNLEEKHDCGGILEAEWNKILEFMLVNSALFKKALELGMVQFTAG